LNHATRPITNEEKKNKFILERDRLTANLHGAVSYYSLYYHKRANRAVSQSSRAT